MVQKTKARRAVLNDVIVYFAFKVPHLSEAKLNKLTFLADLYHYAKRGFRITSVPFRNYRFGPWSAKVAETAQAIDGQEIKIQFEHSRQKGDMMLIRPNVPQATIGLPREALDTLKEVVAQWGGRSLSEIVDFVKRTPMFVSTRFGDQVDFESVPPSPELLRVCSPREAQQIAESLRRHGALVQKAIQVWRPAHA